MASDSGNGKTASSSTAADSYIGSFISLTSKSEFRYEGVLYFLDPQTSVLGLKNVRSFGTEGRQKDGPQVPPSNKIYDYIMFRGSDIKDLQVKISPPAQAEEPTHNDPAIIQSQCVGDLSNPSTVSLSGGSLPVFCSYKEPSKLNMRSYPIVPSSHQSGNQFGELGLSNQATPNSDTLGSNITPTQLQGNSATASRSHYAPLHPIPSVTTSHSITCDFPQAYPAQGPATFTSTVQTSSVTPSSQMPLNITPNLASQQFLVAPTSTSYQHLPSLISSPCESTNTANPAVCKAGLGPISLFPAQSLLYPMFSAVNNIITPSLKQSPSLLTPDQPSQGRLSALSPTETLYPDQKDIQVMSSESLNSLHSVSSAVQAPILPLPSLQSSSEFTEEFDFLAMNEKFNKDEVWGYLGKAKQGDKIEVHKCKALVSENMENDAVLILDADSKPAYSKDDFFDNISRNSVTQGVRNGQNCFNDRMKLDTETFGNLQQRNYPGYGAGRGLNHGSFGWGREHNYRGRGRGVYM